MNGAGGHSGAVREGRGKGVQEVLAGAMGLPGSWSPLSRDLQREKLLECMEVLEQSAEAAPTAVTGTEAEGQGCYKQNEGSKNERENSAQCGIKGTGPAAHWPLRSPDDKGLRQPPAAAGGTATAGERESGPPGGGSLAMGGAAATPVSPLLDFGHMTPSGCPGGRPVGTTPAGYHSLLRELMESPAVSGGQPVGPRQELQLPCASLQHLFESPCGERKRRGEGHVGGEDSAVSKRSKLQGC